MQLPTFGHELQPIRRQQHKSAEEAVQLEARVSKEPATTRRKHCELTSRKRGGLNYPSVRIPRTTSEPHESQFFHLLIYLPQAALCELRKNVAIKLQMIRMNYTLSMSNVMLSLSKQMWQLSNECPRARPKWANFSLNCFNRLFCQIHTFCSMYWCLL